MSLTCELSRYCTVLHRSMPYLTNELDELEGRVGERQVRAGQVREVFGRVATARRRHFRADFLRYSKKKSNFVFKKLTGD